MAVSPAGQGNAEILCGCPVLPAVLFQLRSTTSLSGGEYWKIRLNGSRTKKFQKFYIFFSKRTGIVVLKCLKI